MESLGSLSHRLIPFLLASILLVCMPTLTHQSSPVGFSGSNSTSTREVPALLSFKSLLSDPNNALSSWNNPTLHFCNWLGVTCGGRRHPERVTALELDMMNLTGPLSPSLANLTFLKRLHLAENHLNGSIPPELGRLSRLKHLNLSYNDFEGQIPASLSNCRSLQNISLSNNKLSGRLPPRLSGCSDLRIISLETNLLTGEIPDEIVTLPKLSWLSLASNNFSRGIPAGIGGSSSLTRVVLSNNSLTGTIPPCLGNISTLTYLRLYQNNLRGPIPPSLGNCSNLIYLSLGSNSLEGEIPESLFHKTSLEHFDVSNNKLSGMVPFSLYNLSSIQSLSLGLNQFTGTLPPNLGSTLHGLRYLCVSGSQLEGPIPPSLPNASNLQVLDLYANKFSGPVPSNLGQNLQRVNLGYNWLKARDANDWKFLNSLTNCTNLQFLDLSHNFLAGTFPSSICNLTKQLERLSLSELPMSGTIPEELENLEGLLHLDLGYNNLTGNIPRTIGRLCNLGQLILSGNRLSGPIPASISNLTRLESLDLSGNDLQGNIPTSFIKYVSLNELDLSSNQLSGTIPGEVFRISSLTKSLDLSHNSLVGSLPPDVGYLKLITQLDVSENKLSGKIPIALGDCVTLNYLSMEGNFFEGGIPSYLSNLKSIQWLDLSCNKLSGQIPEFFKDISTLYYLNLSFNDLEGPVPVKGIFTNTSAVFLEGNEKLCGGDPKFQLPLCSNKKKCLASLKILFIIVAPPALIILLSGILCWKKCPRKRYPSESSSNDQYKMVSYTDLHKATGGFSSANLIGVGSFGSVYKGILDAYDKVVAVKVLNLQQTGGLKSYLAECEALRNIRHRNLIKILTTCSSIDHSGNDFKALVFNFMSNGSLEEWLHPRVADNGESRRLSLAERLDIAIDVASALEYLHHHHGKTPVIHCDVKPSNILLDDQKCAHLGDFGLARFLQGNNTSSTQDPTSSIALKGSIGYIAPEYGTGVKASTHGDVYGYGILLLELLTGKRPTDDTFKDGQSLRNFVEMGYPERVMEIVDPIILLIMEAGSPSETMAREGIVECLVSMIDVGLSCSKEAPNARMEMQEVATEMDAIRTSFAGVRSN